MVHLALLAHHEIAWDELCSGSSWKTVAMRTEPQVRTAMLISDVTSTALRKRRNGMP